MLLVKIGVQDGEREYSDWTYYENFNQTDYLEGKITDREILSEFLGFSLTDDDYFDKTTTTYADREKYWNDTSAVWVNNVLNISEQDLKTLKQYGVESCPLPMRQSRTLGGGFHCVTLDLNREGSLESYFD